MYDYDRTADLESKDEYDATIALLDSKLTRFPKGRGWWDPPRNYAVNAAMVGLNGWIFGILPFRANLIAYRPAQRGRPEGIVIDPSWRSDSRITTYGYTPQGAQIFLDLVKEAPTIQKTVETEIHAIETHFGVKIPSSLKSSILKDSLAVAKRRWGTDNLRRRKILVPFDGSKPIPLGSFG